MKVLISINQLKRFFLNILIVFNIDSIGTQGPVFHQKTFNPSHLY